MICACNHCHFLFSRATLPEQCPDCGKFSVRLANEDEVAEYQSIAKEFQRDPV